MEQFGNDEKAKLIWLLSFLGLIGICIILYLFLILFSLPGDLHVPISPVEGCVQLILIYLVLFYVIRKPELIAITLQNPERIFSQQLLLTKPETTKYQKQTLTEEQRKSYLQKMIRIMETEEPYLNDLVSIHDLSERLAIPVHHVSMTINIELSQNFFQFINQYRIERAKLLLSNPKAKDQNVLNIGLEAGFQSKASFNKTFKQFTGFTPSEFRKNSLKDTSLNS
ncbi:hypothetical protein LPTSP3_g08860 [Leptospira kobayashii]|uniref:HTH araC/xylS-type domain-containing protein n=1 Tax=Leptospira kobayashii TaxID=1917830 RepID=A0ABM7URK9_9LEPT|nr:hypothetical protein LPTSP3_g08860 [Leptospira kobayashii]